VSAAGRRVGFHTFGCKLNQYETEALAAAFRDQGFSVVGSGDEADAYVINTCTVTARADHKARALIRGLARGRPDALLVVTGCSAQVEAEALAALSASVMVVPQEEKSRLLGLPAVLAAAPEGEPLAAAAAGLRATASRWAAARDPFAFAAGGLSFHTRAFLKIQDGCDARCAYCRVPLARGPAVSLDPARVVARAAEIEARGCREIVLTGVHVSAYAAEGADLAGLLGRILDATTRPRLRLSSLEPESVTEDLARVLAHPRICPHFHLPVQSGSDAVLAGMRRRYRAERVRRSVELLRAAKEDPFMAADMIAGFPGETDQDHALSMDLVRSLSFSALHVFPFSPRAGTDAFSMRPAVPERVRSGRAAELAAVARAQSLAYARSWVGREVEALLESGRGGKARGTSGNYLKLEIAGVPGPAAGRLVSARVTGAGERCAAAFLGFRD
jgi:threonylcarbamoyladenosine tRNA methylthiotransferase MtaB